MYALAGTSICQHKSANIEHKIQEVEDKDTEYEDEEDLVLLAGRKDNLL